MRRLCVISAVFFVIGSGAFVGCTSKKAPKNEDPKQVEIDPNKIKIAPPIDKNNDVPPKKLIVKIDAKQDKYEAALGDALGASAARNWDDAMSAFKAAQKFQDTEFVRSEIAKLQERIAQDGVAKNAVKNIEVVLADGNADDAAKLAKDALKEFGGGDDADKLVELRIQAEAIRDAEKKEGAGVRFTRFKNEGDLAVEEKNLRAAALAYEQALAAQPDAGLQTICDGIRAKVDEYDALRKKGNELRRAGMQMDEALAAFQRAADAWDTQQIRSDIDDCKLALAKRRDVVAVADFELRNDVGMPGAGSVIAAELLPRLKPKYDLVECDQLRLILSQLPLQPGFLDDPKQQRQIGQLANARYLVVGSVQRLVGVSIRARLVDVRTGLVVQTGKIVAADLEEAINQIPDLAKQLMLTDEAKIQMEQDAQQQAALPVPKAPDNAVIPAAPMPLAAEAPPPAMVNPAPPVFADAKVVFFKNFAPQPDVVAAPPVDPLQGVLRNRLLYATVEKGDYLFQAGRFAEAQRQFQFALMLAPDNADIQVRLQQVLPLVPPTPFGYVPRPRIAILPFMTVGNPFVVPPYLGYWTPQNLAPYFAWRYDVADPGEIYWYMGRMGLTMNDLLVDPAARRWLGRAAGVRYFVFGNLVQTSSFDANTYMLDAEYGYLQGQARINVNDPYELKLRLSELAQLTMMTPAEQAAYQMARLQQLIYAGQVHMAQGFFRKAADEFQKALAIDPYNVQVQILLQSALAQADFQDFVNGQQQRYLAQQAMWAAQRQRQRDLAQASELARRQAIADAAARSDADRQRRAAVRIDAQVVLGNRAQFALTAGNFRFSLSLFRGASGVAPAQPINYQGLAQAQVGAQRAEQVRVAQFTAVQATAQLKVRDQQLAQAQQALVKEQAQSQKNLAALQATQSKRDEQAYQAGVAQGQQYMKQNKYAAALTAFQGAQRFKQTDQVSTLIDGVVQQQAASSAKTPGDKAAVEKRLQAERERRMAAEAQARQNDNNYHMALSAAQTALAAKNYDAAQAKFQEAGKVFKTDAVLTGLKQIESARAAQLAVSQKADTDKKKGDLVRQYVSEGQAALGAKRYADALKSFQQAKKLAPDNLDALAGLNQAELGQQRLAQNTKDPGKEKTLPVDPLAANKLKMKEFIATGQAALKLKDYDAAEKALRSAGQIDPADPAVVKGLNDIQAGRLGLADQKQRLADHQTALTTGQKALTAKNYAAAIKSFQQALKLMPDDAAARTGLAQAQQAQQDAGTAALKAATYQKAMTTGQTALFNKKYADAVKSFKDALQAQPNDQKATQQLAQAQQLLTDSSKIKTPPDPPKQDFDGAMKRAAAAETDLNYGEALKAYREALKIRPKDLTAAGKAQFAQYIVNGQQYLDNMMWVDAARELEGALRLQPKNAYALKLYQKAKNKGK